MIYLIFLFITFNTFAYSYKTPPTPVTTSQPTKKEKAVRNERSNLPAYFKNRSISTDTADTNYVILPEKKDAVNLNGIRAGDVLLGEIEQAITASPNVATPVRVKILSGNFKNSFFLGTATLDKDLQRVLIDVNRLRINDREQTFSIKAQVLSPTGEIGLTGDLHTKEMLFFVAEMMSATAAGYFDATVSRSQNQLGTYQTEPSVENSARLGLANAMSKSADRFAEKQRTSPGYTTTSGFRTVRVIVTEDPTEIN